MRRLSKPIFLAGLICVFLSACSRENELLKAETPPPSDLPKLVVTLGVDYHDVAKLSTARVEFPDPYPGTGMNNFHDSYPHQLVYNHPTRGFVLPRMEPFFISAIKGRVDYISDRAAPKYTVLDDAINWCQSAMRVIDNAGWERDDSSVTKLYSGDTFQSYKSFDDLRRAFLDKEAKIPLKGVTVAAWRHDQEIISLELQRARFYDPVPDDLSKESNYIIEVNIDYDCIKVGSCVNGVPVNSGVK